MTSLTSYQDHREPPPNGIHTPYLWKIIIVTENAAKLKRAEVTAFSERVGLNVL